MPQVALKTLLRFPHPMNDPICFADTILRNAKQRNRKEDISHANTFARFNPDLCYPMCFWSHTHTPYTKHLTDRDIRRRIGCFIARYEGEKTNRNCRNFANLCRSVSCHFFATYRLSSLPSNANANKMAINQVIDDLSHQRNHNQINYTIQLWHSTAAHTQFTMRTTEMTTNDVDGERIRQNENAMHFAFDRYRHGDQPISIIINFIILSMRSPSLSYLLLLQQVDQIFKIRLTTQVRLLYDYYCYASGATYYT